MAPNVHCVRHAQGHHNLSVANHQMHDPLLTPYGEEQCRNLRKTFPNIDKVDLVVASPLKRTVYTALLSFESVLKEKKLKIICLPELQETSDLPCDTGSAPDELAKEFEGKPVDLSLVNWGWNSKRMKWAPNAPAIERRAREARQWLMARPEKEIVVVSHGGYLHYLTEDWSDSARFAGTGWANTEFRSYSSSTYQADEAHFTETQESRRRRLGDEKPLDHNEATQLKRTSTNERKQETSDYLDKAAKTNDVQAIQAKV
ncbi:uncharacterized protein LTR77_010287 [Saxophila tyrrhenica]|uniref:Phosphoglycerate mutase n=1 Tax=Saxophila tyrrhenica TaxID=1690608 RepID=A0AAV9NVM0_9PEZI|nr:hypothetical protein LTR77_010287 [Saxophila tyrrhenica]